VWNDEFPLGPNLRLLNAHGAPGVPNLSLTAIIKLAEVCKEIQVAAGREPV
jgi:hypothetical protein